MTNSRNQFGVKDSANCYRNIAGVKFEQWSDFYTNASGESCEAYTKEQRIEALAFHKSQNPNREFKAIKIDGRFYRIYAKA